MKNSYSVCLIPHISHGLLRASKCRARPNASMPVLPRGRRRRRARTYNVDAAGCSSET
jgi:hypothetical protein